MKKILMIGPGRDVRGGISTVVNSYYELGIEKDTEIKYIPTMEDGSQIKKLIVAVKAYMEFGGCVKKYDIVHVHMAAQASFVRKSLFVQKANYVMFIDSDDYLAENVVEKLLEKLLTEKVDAAFTGMIRFNDDKILSEVDRKYKDNTFRENELCEKYLMEMAGTLPDEPIDSYLYMSVCTGL